MPECVCVYIKVGSRVYQNVCKSLYVQICVCLCVYVLKRARVCARMCAFVYIKVYLSVWLESVYVCNSLYVQICVCSRVFESVFLYASVFVRVQERALVSLLNYISAFIGICVCCKFLNVQIGLY